MKCVGATKDEQGLDENMQKEGENGGNRGNRDGGAEKADRQTLREEQKASCHACKASSRYEMRANGLPRPRNNVATPP